MIYINEGERFKHWKYALLCSIPHTIRFALKQSEAYILGGAVNSIINLKQINDYDIYCRSKEEAEELNLWFKYHVKRTVKDNVFGTQYRVFDRQYHVVRNKKLIMESEDTMFDKFDFTVCMCGYDFKNDRFLFHDDFFKHNDEKKLVLNYTSPAVFNSMSRIDKYISKGYKISDREIHKLELYFTSVDIKKMYEIFKEAYEDYDVDVASRREDLLDHFKEWKFSHIKKYDPLGLEESLRWGN